jgi:hypothetical protein
MVLVLEVVGFGSVGDFTGSCFGTEGATGIGGFGTGGVGIGGVGTGGVGIGFSGTGSGFVTSGATGSGRGTGGAGTLSLIPPGEPSAGASVAAKLSPSPATNSKIFVAGFDSKLFEYAASSSTATTRPWRTTEVTKAAGIRSLMVRGGSATKTAEATIS